MSAFNWINVETTCPKCGSATNLRCQPHVASGYAGDSRGRFHDRDYGLGEPMWWWSKDDARYPDWRVEGREGIAEYDYDEEACLAECGSCGASLCVVLAFRAATPERLLTVAPEEEWPEGYLK